MKINARQSLLFLFFCTGLFAFTASGLVPTGARAADQRKSVTDLSAKELMSLRRGVAVMMARNSAPPGSADYLRSWIYWLSLIHISEPTRPY